MSTETNVIADLIDDLLTAATSQDASLFASVAREIDQRELNLWTRINGSEISVSDDEAGEKPRFKITVTEV